jgi:alpha-mannosidase
MVTIPIQSTVSLIPGVPCVDLHTEINNLAKDHRLRVHFPAPFAVSEANYDGHFEVVKRSLGVSEKGKEWVEDPRPEVPQRAFTDIADGKVGLMIADRGLPEVEVIELNGNIWIEIALTLIQSVGVLSRDDMSVRQGHAGPASEMHGAQVPRKWVYDYAILPQQGNWQGVYQQAYAFETPLRAIESGLQAGELPVEASFISHTPAAFVISAVKETEDEKGWLVRRFNISAQKIQLKLKPLRKFRQAKLVNLAEKKTPV